MKVYRIFSIIDHEIVPEEPWPSRCVYRNGDVIGLLMNLRAAENPADLQWTVEVRFATDKERQEIKLPLERFLSAADLDASSRKPLAFSGLRLVRPSPNDADGPSQDLSWLWIFRDALYVTERAPRSAEMTDVALEIKALFFRRTDDLRRLREEVANYEAIETNTGRSSGRPPVPDDVKLAVWSRDGGACVRCGSKAELHFDHVIPYSRGGSSIADNLQVLCRTCNLAKANRLA